MKIKCHKKIKRPRRSLYGLSYFLVSMLYSGIRFWGNTLVLWRKSISWEIWPLINLREEKIPFEKDNVWDSCSYLEWVSLGWWGGRGLMTLPSEKVNLCQVLVRTYRYFSNGYITLDSSFKFWTKSWSRFTAPWQQSLWPWQVTPPTTKQEVWECEEAREWGTHM